MSQLKYPLGTLTNRKGKQTTDPVVLKKDDIIVKSANLIPWFPNKTLRDAEYVPV